MSNNFIHISELSIENKMADRYVVVSSEQEKLQKDVQEMRPEVLAVWTEALTTDDEVTARGILEAAGHSLRHYLLTGDFLCECHEMENLYQDRRLRIPGFKITRPWTLTVAFGAFKIMKVFLEYEKDMDVCQTDRLDNNIFHCLVYLCYLDCDREEEFVETYIKLCDLLKPSQIKKLLYTENSSQKRPMELAAHVGAFKMLATIFETKGVYLVKTKLLQYFYKVHWYDVTEYENLCSSNRSKNSPLWYLASLDEERLRAATKEKIFRSDPFFNWMQKKSTVVLPLMWAWSVLRLLFILIFTLYDFSGPQVNLEASELMSTPSFIVNSSLPIPCDAKLIPLPRTFRIIFVTILMIICICVIVADFIEFIFFHFLNGHPMSHLPRRHKKYVVFIKVYRINQLLLMICMFITLILRNVPCSTPAVLTMKHILYVLVWTFSIWSILYFLQRIPFMGYFVSTIQSMIMDLSRFFIIFLLMLVPFAFSFHRIARDNQNCDKRFETLPLSMYTTFTVMLNMVDFSNQPRGDFVTYALIHLVFVFLVAILLVNFLIALFSQTASEVREHRDAIIAIQELSMIWTLEFRFSWLLTKSELYRKRMEKTFFVKEGRVYVTRVEVRCGKPLTPGIVPRITEV